MLVFCLILLAVPEIASRVAITTSGLTLEATIDLKTMAKWIKDYRFNYLLLEQYLQNTTALDTDTDAGKIRSDTQI